MKWRVLLEIIGSEPVFSSSLLRTGDHDPIDLGRQLTRWVSTGKLLQLRRGLYVLAPPYRKTTPHPFFVANRMRRGSYVSLQSALEFHGLIPEHAPNVTSVTTGRPDTASTPLGVFIFRNIKREFFFGYEKTDLGDGQEAWVAGPEKALLDLVHLTPRRPGKPGEEVGVGEAAFFDELRLQNTGALSPDRLRAIGARMDGPKIRRAIRRIEALIEEEAGS